MGTSPGAEGTLVFGSMLIVVITTANGPIPDQRSAEKQKGGGRTIDICGRCADVGLRPVAYAVCRRAAQIATR
jgi:hypothetical protein